ncbi:hypothetical protein GCM10010170_058800 [Dactylosporangium salmoneum]|uniref:Ferredoxin n=2 Tax=Dactylosporangium salmoneum TaxID=53361 RepID=A0ABP5TVD3_9ACTN
MGPDASGDELYWDPIASVEAMFPFDENRLRPTPEHVFLGNWEDRNWRNVPGPFYGAMTDSCWVGRIYAPRHFLYGDDNDGDSEFLYRQPRDSDDLTAVLRGMQADPFSGWARDGDVHWTPALVREWWGNRNRLLEWIAEKQRHWIYGDEAEREAVSGLLDYRAYIDADLANDLRLYLYFLDNGNGPLPGVRLPDV